MRVTLFVLFIGLGGLATPSQGAAPGFAHWRGEGKPGSDVSDRSRPDRGDLDLAATVELPNGATFRRSDDVPGRFIYDPIAGESYSNTTSFELRGTDFPKLRVPFKPEPDTSFTLEMFVKPRQDVSRSVRLIGKSRRSDDGTELGVILRRLHNFNQTYYTGTVVEPNKRSIDWSTGHYVTISRLSGNPLTWRHVALVYDAPSRTATVYLDHWQAASQVLTSAPNWDDAPVMIGGFNGWFDEVRITDTALSPAQFLRARDDAIQGISFASRETVLPRGSGYLDLREHFGAVGDGKTDATAAFRKAFADLSSKVPAHYFTLYIPPGEYLVSGLCQCSRFIVLQGAGRDQTTIRLKDECDGFGNPDKPLPVIRASSTFGPPGSNRAVNGSSIGIYLFDLSIDTGKGNSGAKALEYHSNNHGGVERVSLRSGDGAGVVGLDLTHKTNGPALIKDVIIHGFQYGITFQYMEYSMTLEDVTLTGQSKAGILNQGNIMAMRKIRSQNRVPALISEGAVSMIALLDSELTGGDPQSPAIRCEGGLFARNIRTEGYARGVEGVDEKNHIKELVLGDRVNPRPPEGEPLSSLNLPIEETPSVEWGDIHDDWVNVWDFADQRDGDDWTPAIQAAIDSGKKTVYFPQGGYSCRGTVHVRGTIERLFGMKSKLHRNRDDDDPEPVLIFDDPSPVKIVELERLDVQSLRHASPGTMVIRHGSPDTYTNAPGCGKLFMEDVQGADYRFEHPQQVWVRQWNIEKHGPGPCVVSKGATIWSLGFKTEYESSKLWGSDGAKTEILGGLIYPVNRGIPRDRPVFKNIDSSMTLQYGLSIYTAGHDLQVLDTQGEDTKEVRIDALKRVGARFRMDLYTSQD